jgi:hypothetical protein
MTDSSAQEPTMEEILASIRRIISEDEAPVAEASDETAGPEGDEILELTERVQEPEPAPQPEPVQQHESIGDIDAFTAPEPAPRAPRQSPQPLQQASWSAPEPENRYEAPSEPLSWSVAGAEIDEDEPLVASHRADAAAGHFGALAQSLAMPAGGRTLEDVVRELLRPLLKEWLDQNLPHIVEARVQAEVERIARRRNY